MAANQNRAPLIIGYPTGIGGNASTLALNSATNQIWLALQVVLDQTKTLSKVKLFLSAKTGSPTAAGCTCDLYSDTGGIPNASTEGPISADSVPAAGNWMQWTFAGTSSLVAGTPYWFVWKNSTGTPGSNFPTYRWAGTSTGTAAMPIGSASNISTAPLYGWNKVGTTNAGAAWATALQTGVAGVRLEYTDATFDGIPAQDAVRPGTVTTADRAFGKSEVGVRFNLPANATYNVRGLAFMLSKTSTPGDLRFRLYQGVTLLATTYAIPATSVTTGTAGDWYTGYFSAPQSIVSTNNPFRVVIGDATAADANTVGYNPQLITIENDASSLALKPMNGTLQKTITADNTANPVVFVDTATDIMPFAMLLDSAGEFTAGASGGGGLVIGSSLVGGVR